MSGTVPLMKDFASDRFDAGEVEIHFVHAGKGPPLLMLHGYPQCHVMWHRIAPALSEKFHVICPDLRGYGESSKPDSVEDHSNYSKRVMAADMVALMDHLGYPRFMLAGHDRGARVAHRLALDHPDAVERLCVLDIAPTRIMFAATDQAFATGYYHWFFLIQPNGLPERLLANDPDYYIEAKMGHWSADDARFDEQAMEKYKEYFRDPETIRASCEDYRAAASIDLTHDHSDMHVRVRCPVLVLWGDKGFVHRQFDVLDCWEQCADDVSGKSLPSGHFLAEECPDDVLEEFQRFFDPASVPTEKGTGPHGDQTSLLASSERVETKGWRSPSSLKKIYSYLAAALAPFALILIVTAMMHAYEQSGSRDVLRIELTKTGALDMSLEDLNSFIGARVREEDYPFPDTEGSEFDLQTGRLLFWDSGTYTIRATIDDDSVDVIKVVGDYPDSLHRLAEWHEREINDAAGIVNVLTGLGLLLMLGIGVMMVWNRVELRRPMLISIAVSLGLALVAAIT